MGMVHEWTFSVTISLLTIALVLCTQVVCAHAMEQACVRDAKLWKVVRIASVVLFIGAVLRAFSPLTNALGAEWGRWLGLANVVAGLVMMTGVGAALIQRNRLEHKDGISKTIEQRQALVPCPSDIRIASSEQLLQPDMQRASSDMALSSADVGTGLSESKAIAVLVADGSEAVHDLVKGYLTGTLYAPQFARTGTEALSKFQSSRFRIVLIDIQLPELDGTAVIGMIREWEANNSQARTPVVAMIAKAATEYAEQGALGTGASSHVRKPLSRAKLLQALEVCKGQFLANKSTSVSSAAAEIPEAMLPQIPAFITRRLREVDQLKRECLAQNAPGLSLIADEIADVGSTTGFPRLTQIGRTLASAASQSDWTGVADSIRDLEFYLEGLQSSAPVSMAPSEV